MHSGCLVFINGYVTSIIPAYNQNGAVTSFFLFDSHCKNSQGITTPIGFSVLLQFLTLCEIEQYFIVAYNAHNCEHPLYFQIQFVSFNVSDKVSVIQHFKKQRKRQKAKQLHSVAKKKI